MNWAQEAQIMVKAAERARLEGDEVAMVALLVRAAQCARIARLLSTPHQPHKSVT